MLEEQKVQSDNYLERLKAFASKYPELQGRILELRSIDDSLNTLSVFSNLLTTVMLEGAPTTEEVEKAKSTYQAYLQFLESIPNDVIETAKLIEEFQKLGVSIDTENWDELEKNVDSFQTLVREELNSKTA